jgi:hypothetical protein
MPRTISSFAVLAFDEVTACRLVQQSNPLIQQRGLHYVAGRFGVKVLVAVRTPRLAAF